MVTRAVNWTALSSAMQPFSPVAAKLDADQLETVLQSAADGITVLDARGRLVFANDAAARLIGLVSGEQLLATPIEAVRARFEVVDEQGEPLAAERWPGQSALQGEPLAEAVLRYRLRESGEVRWSLVRAAPIRDAKGEIRFEVTVTQDITALKQSEARLRLLADASALMASSLDYDQTLAEVARLAVPEFGDWAAVDLVLESGEIEQVAVSHDDPETALWAQTKLDPPDSDSEVQTGVLGVIRSGRPAFYPVGAGHRADDGGRQGETGSARVALIVPLQARRRILGAITFVKATASQPYQVSDLTFAQVLATRAALAVDNARLYREAQDALRVRNEVIAAISHDLRTPLTTIKGMSSLLTKRLSSETAPPRDIVIERLDLVGRAATQMERMIEDFLDLSRLDSGRPIELDRQSVDLVALGRRLATEYQGQTSEHQLQVETQLAELTGLWDGSRVERVVMNLLSNAIKYSPDGGVIIVSIGRETDESGREWARLDVHDRGLGVPAGELGRVFERFYRGSNVTGSTRGMGLGLTGFQVIVRQHGGRLSLTSEEAKGSVATMRLPLGRPGSG